MNHLPRLALMLFVWVAIGSQRSQADNPEARLVDGAPFRGELQSVDAAWKIRFANAPQGREVAAADLVAWGQFVDATRGPQLLLSGGGMVVAAVSGLDKEVLSTDSDLFGPVKLPLEAVVGILFRPPADAARRDQLLARILGATGETDRLILDNGDELAGTAAGLASMGEKLLFETETGPLEVEIEKITALVFNPALASRTRAAGLRMLVGFKDGSRVVAASMKTAEKQTALKLAGGAELPAPTSAIVALQPFGGRAVYLSDLKPASYRHIPYLQLSWPYHADANALGGRLRAVGKLYVKGLGMHSASRLTYDLDQPYKSLQAELAIDDATAGRGSVVFRVVIDDGSGKWQPRYASPIVRGDAAPIAISVDLKGAKRFSLLVDYADRGDELDHADWLNARLVK